MATNSPRQKRQHLLKLAQKLEVLKTGHFQLASGQSSSLYIDGRILALDSRGAQLIGQIIFDFLGDSQSVGGPATGAIAIVAAILSEAGKNQRPLKGFYWRQTNKDHGRQRQSEGQIRSPVTLVDDVCTTGNSLIELAANLEADGHKINQIITVCDRGGGDNIKSQGYHYRSLLKLENNQLTVG